MITTTLTETQLVFLGALGYCIGYSITRIAGGGYVTNHKFDSFVNQYKVDQANMTDKLVRIQQRYSQEDMQDNKSSDFFDKIVNLLAQKVINALTKKNE